MLCEQAVVLYHRAQASMQVQMGLCGMCVRVQSWCEWVPSASVTGECAYLVSIVTRCQCLVVSIVHAWVSVSESESLQEWVNEHYQYHTEDIPVLIVYPCHGFSNHGVGTSRVKVHLKCSPSEHGNAWNTWKDRLEEYWLSLGNRGCINPKCNWWPLWQCDQQREQVEDAMQCNTT